MRKTTSSKILNRGISIAALGAVAALFSTGATPAAAAAPAGRTCPMAPGPAISDASPPTAATFKRVVYDQQTPPRPPVSWGLTFEMWNVGAPARNTVTVDPGRGAERLFEAAPVGATMWPIESTTVTCEQGLFSFSRVRSRDNYWCYKNRFRHWECGRWGPLKLTTLE